MPPPRASQRPAVGARSVVLPLRHSSPTPEFSLVAVGRGSVPRRGRHSPHAHAPCRRPFPPAGTYLSSLSSSMVNLINKDYGDFVNLSTNLVRPSQRRLQRRPLQPTHHPAHGVPYALFPCLAGGWCCPAKAAGGHARRACGQLEPPFAAAPPHISPAARGIPVQLRNAGWAARVPARSAPRRTTPGWPRHDHRRLDHAALRVPGWHPGAGGGLLCLRLRVLQVRGALPTASSAAEPDSAGRLGDCVAVTWPQAVKKSVDKEIRDLENEMRKRAVVRERKVPLPTAHSSAAPARTQQGVGLLVAAARPFFCGECVVPVGWRRRRRQLGQAPCRCPQSCPPVARQSFSPTLPCAVLRNWVLETTGAAAAFPAHRIVR